jgi:hypothetical protein
MGWPGPHGHAGAVTIPERSSGSMLRDRHDGNNRRDHEAGTMKGRAASWVAWSLATLTVLFTVVHVTLWTLAQPIRGAVDTRGEAGLPIAFAVVGALIVTRRPGNRIGWLFCAGVVFALGPALDAYALYALPPGLLPACRAPPRPPGSPPGSGWWASCCSCWCRCYSQTASCRRRAGTRSSG